jgi:NTE family protein
MASGDNEDKYYECATEILPPDWGDFATGAPMTRRPATPTRPAFERVALLLQGGGALGAYQCGVYQAFVEADLHANCVFGVSIGSINAALIAGNPPGERVAALRTFWERITAPPFGFPIVGTYLGFLERAGNAQRGLLHQTHAFVSAAGGAPGFFTPRALPPSFATPGSAAAQSLYDTSPLRATLEELVDFDRINSREMWFAVGAVNVRTGDFDYFDNTNCEIRPEHIMASGAIPPAFPAVEVDGEFYWDGGLVSNTPLLHLLEARSRKDTLAFQVDLWSAEGKPPQTILDLDLREKDIRFSSRTRASTDRFRETQRARRAVHRLLEALPEDIVIDPEDLRLLSEGADEKVCNIVHLIYRAKEFEGACKDFEFSRETMEAHWSAGFIDATESLRHREIFTPPTTPDGVGVFDFTPRTKRVRP